MSDIFSTFAPEFVKLGNCVNIVVKITTLRDTINRRTKNMADIEKISTQQLDTPFKSDEYKELLLQAVAVIESARFRLARQVELPQMIHIGKCKSATRYCTFAMVT